MSTNTVHSERTLATVRELWDYNQSAEIRNAELDYVQKSQIHSYQQGCTIEPDDQRLQFPCPTSNSLLFRNYNRDKDERLCALWTSRC